MSDAIPERRRPNRLIEETSPYLLQHAYNPVDWYPWCEAALERAKNEDRLILLSIGYAACHWCHVMERESFENEDIAAVMNENFVNIKVDKEERPDLDDIYMAATLAMNAGQGGWPMTVFLTPNQEPVFAGTYFPPTDAYGRPGFLTILNTIAHAWGEDRSKLRDQGRGVADYLRRQRSATEPGIEIGTPAFELALSQYSEEFDPVHGGFGAAPKFPPATSLALLLRLHDRLKDPRALLMVGKTLDAMASGGIYDHLGGGFARYSTDRAWLVPHFEKMLYDNALLANTYLEGYQAIGNSLYERIATETLDFVRREMRSPEGGFYSSWDADSEGAEGRFYVWSLEEISQLFDEETTRQLSAYFDITASGNWKGTNILNIPRPLQTVARELAIPTEELADNVEDGRRHLYAARSTRIRPGLDDKVLTSWNGLMISAFASGYRVLGVAEYLESARGAADLLLGRVSDDDGRPLRTWRNGKAHLAAYLEDYAYLSEGLLDLYEASGDARYLSEAKRLAEMMIDDFRDVDSGSFFSTSRRHERLLLRHRDGADGATPSANATAASALARLSYHLDRSDFREIALSALKAYGSAVARYPRAFAKSLLVIDFLMDGPVEIALVGVAGSKDLQELRREVGRHFVPRRIEAVGDPAATGTEIPMLRDKPLVDGRAALYVCRGFACQAPVTSAKDVAGALAVNA
jgi:uncharacterized protein YyaL (SSP411 family)